MEQFINLFGKEIPVYGICYFGGIFLAAFIAVIIAPKRKIERYDVVYSAVYSVIAGVIGAKLLFIAVSYKQIIALGGSLDALLKGGFVFYGGIIGGALGLLIYCKQFKMPILPMADIYGVVIPIGHAFGRVGCHFAGCCYGMELDSPISVVYKTTIGTTPINVPLLPIQLIEAGGLLLIFAVLLLILLKKDLKEGSIAAVYMVLYSLFRFIIEYFRGDRERGMYLKLSTSQWVSIGLLTVGIILLVFKMRSKKLKQNI